MKTVILQFTLLFFVVGCNSTKNIYQPSKDPLVLFPVRYLYGEKDYFETCIDIDFDETPLVEVIVGICRKWMIKHPDVVLPKIMLDDPSSRDCWEEGCNYKFGDGPTCNHYRGPKVTFIRKNTTVRGALKHIAELTGMRYEEYYGGIWLQKRSIEIKSVPWGKVYKLSETQFKAFIDLEDDTTSLRQKLILYGLLQHEGSACALRNADERSILFTGDDEEHKKFEHFLEFIEKNSINGS